MELMDNALYIGTITRHRKVSEKCFTLSAPDSSWRANTNRACYVVTPLPQKEAAFTNLVIRQVGYINVAV